MISSKDMFDHEQFVQDEGYVQPYNYSNDDECNILDNLEENNDVYDELNFDNNEVRA